MNLTTIILENFSAVLATLSSLIGVFLGSYFTGKTQKNSFKNQLELERNKREINKLGELTMLYNKLLMLDGEKEVIDYNQGRNLNFMTPVYQKEIRPILYEKFHLLHSDVAEIVKEIDEVIVKWSVIEEESYDGESEYIAALYLKMITKVNSYVDLLRVK
ncbi:MAG: hypothetical protein ABS939_21490 [Psychrobacillus sp.]